MLEEKTSIGPGLLFCLLFPTIFGYALPKIGAIAAQTIGFNGYWGLLTASLLGLALIMVIVSFSRSFPGETIIDLLPKYLGKPIGSTIGFEIALFLLALVMWEIKAVVDSFHIYFLIRTPLWVMTAVLLLSAVYIGSKGIEGIARLAAFLFILPLILIVIILVTSLRLFEPDNIRPIFYFKISNLARGTFHLAHIFFLLASLFVINRYVSQKKKVFRTIAGAAGLSIFLLFSFTIIKLGVFGAKGILQINYPFMELSKQTDIALMQTSGLFFAAVYLIEMLISISFAAADACARLVGKLNYRWFLYIIFPFLLYGTLRLKNDLEAVRDFDIFKKNWFLCHICFSIIVLGLYDDYEKEVCS